MNSIGTLRHGLPPEISGLSSNVFTLTIPPGEIFPLEQPGQFFYFLDCPKTVFVRVPGMSEMPHNVGTGQRVETNSHFRRLEFRNPHDHEMTIQVFIGILDGYIDNRFNLVNDRGVVERKTRIVTTGLTAIPANSVLTFTGDFSHPLIHRKCAYVSNEDLALKLYIRNSDGKRILPVWPEASIVIETSDGFEVENPHNSPITALITETVYY